MGRFNYGKIKITNHTYMHLTENFNVKLIYTLQKYGYFVLKCHGHTHICSTYLFLKGDISRCSMCVPMSYLGALSDGILNVYNVLCYYVNV